MWRFKSCQRCKSGDVYTEYDEKGRAIVVCLQCSYETHVNETAALDKHLDRVIHITDKRLVHC